MTLPVSQGAPILVGRSEFVETLSMFHGALLQLEPESVETQPLSQGVLTSRGSSEWVEALSVSESAAT